MDTIVGEYDCVRGKAFANTLLGVKIWARWSEERDRFVEQQARQDAGRRLSGSDGRMLKYLSPHLTVVWEDHI